MKKIVLCILSCAISISFLNAQQYYNAQIEDSQISIAYDFPSDLTAKTDFIDISKRGIKINGLRDSVAFWMRASETGLSFYSEDKSHALFINPFQPETGGDFPGPVYRRTTEYTTESGFVVRYNIVFEGYSDTLESFIQVDRDGVIKTGYQNFPEYQQPDDEFFGYFELVHVDTALLEQYVTGKSSTKPYDLRNESSSIELSPYKPGAHLTNHHMVYTPSFQTSLHEKSLTDFRIEKTQNGLRVSSAEIPATYNFTSVKLFSVDGKLLKEATEISGYWFFIDQNIDWAQPLIISVFDQNKVLGTKRIVFNR